MSNYFLANFIQHFLFDLVNPTIKNIETMQFSIINAIKIVQY